MAFDADRRDTGLRTCSLATENAKRGAPDSIRGTPSLYTLVKLSAIRRSCRLPWWRSRPTYTSVARPVSSAPMKPEFFALLQKVRSVDGPGGLGIDDRQVGGAAGLEGHALHAQDASRGLAPMSSRHALPADDLARRRPGCVMTRPRLSLQADHAERRQLELAVLLPSRRAGHGR